MPTVGLAQPREFGSEATAANVPIDLTQTQVIYEDAEAAGRLYITHQQPTRTIMVKTRTGPIPVQVIDKFKFFCLSANEFKGRAVSISVITFEEFRDGRQSECSGKVIVSDAKGDMVARFADVGQALEHFKRIEFDGTKMSGYAKLLLPVVRPARVRNKKGKFTVEEIAAAATAAVMAAQRGLAPQPVRARGKKSEEQEEAV